MKNFSVVIVSIIALCGAAFAQKAAIRPKSPAKPASSLPAGVPAAAGREKDEPLAGRTYTNKDFAFEITFPTTWLIPGDDFEAEMKKAGFDLSLSPPSGLSGVDRARMNKALQQVKILLTAYRSMPGSADNAIVRISAEDLSVNPQIRDAVDYFDAMRAQFRSMKLPADFKYSETGAEKLGKQQFGYLDSSSNAGKKRLYATVRSGHAILFSISYSKDEDLQALRRVLSDGNFSLK